MPRLLLTWLTNCIGLLVASALIPSISYSHKLETLVLAGLILGLVNFAVRPLVVLLTLPAVLLSLGVALLFVNALMLWLTSRLVTGFHVGGFWSTVGGALMMWLINLALRPWVGAKGRGRSERRRRGSREPARARSRR
jgi:putative membrane protein